MWNCRCAVMAHWRHLTIVAASRRYSRYSGIDSALFNTWRWCRSRSRRRGALLVSVGVGVGVGVGVCLVSVLEHLERWERILPGVCNVYSDICHELLIFLHPCHDTTLPWHNHAMTHSSNSYLIRRGHLPSTSRIRTWRGLSFCFPSHHQ